MIGIDVVGALLLRSHAVLAFASAERIKAGRLPDNIILPALLVRCVSVVDSQLLKRRPTDRSTARIRVTVRAASYEDQLTGIQLIRAACIGFDGDIASALRASVLTAGTGPDILGPGNSFEQSQDFRVTYDAAA